jgi:hypothetical protein
METFYVSPDDIWEREIGNEKCTGGWCGVISRYPKKCVCGGLIHADFGDEDYDCNYWLYEKCDKCGKDFEEME